MMGRDRCGTVYVPIMADADTTMKLAVLTSGGDSAGMNAAVRAVVRAGLTAGLEVFVVEEGLQGLVDGGDKIRSATSVDVSGILQLGGTVFGTARSADFRTRDGLRQAARNLAERGINALIVVGGDGSLSGADEFRTEWPSLLDELVAAGELTSEQVEPIRDLSLAGLVGSIDNDMFGTDMTIGADTALHRITEAVDAIQSTASSHQRTFIIEVMGRRCGYLALMSALSAGANFVLIPENPPRDGWEDSMCEVLGGGRTIGRRASVVIVAEGACDRHGSPISSEYVRDVLVHRLGEDVRVTILGHVQRGGSPSAFDRYLGTVLGHAAVQEVLASPGGEPQLIGIRGHRVVRSPLMECVKATREVADAIKANDVDRAMELRGGSFSDSYRLLKTLVRAQPRAAEAGNRSLRLLVLHGGGPAPGMNTAVRVALRVTMDRGHTLVAAQNGCRGLLDGDLHELDWMSVSGWVSQPGAELGTTRFVPSAKQMPAVARVIKQNEIDGVLMIGGWSGYEAALALTRSLDEVGGPGVPVLCVPATINNDLPGTELSIGADTALNSIAGDVDKIKESAVASNRCFIVEVMGHDCGYLAMVSALATGAERVYLPEEGIALAQLQADLDALRGGFSKGKRRGLVIRSEKSDPLYTTEFISRLFAHESDGRFNVRNAILGHVQQGGNPTPFDRILATRLASAAADRLIELVHASAPTSEMIGLSGGEVKFTPLRDFPALVEPDVHRVRGPRWWHQLRPLADEMAGLTPDR